MSMKRIPTAMAVSVALVAVSCSAGTAPPATGPATDAEAPPDEHGEQDELVPVGPADSDEAEVEDDVSPAAAEMVVDLADLDDPGDWSSVDDLATTDPRPAGCDAYRRALLFDQQAEARGLYHQAMSVISRAAEHDDPEAVFEAVRRLPSCGTFTVEDGLLGEVDVEATAADAPSVGDAAAAVTLTYGGETTGALVAFRRGATVGVLVLRDAFGLPALESAVDLAQAVDDRATGGQALPDEGPDDAPLEVDGGTLLLAPGDLPGGEWQRYELTRQDVPRDEGSSTCDGAEQRQSSIGFGEMEGFAGANFLGERGLLIQYVAADPRAQEFFDEVEAGADCRQIEEDYDDGSTFRGSVRRVDTTGIGDASVGYVIDGTWTMNGSTDEGLIVTIVFRRRGVTQLIGALVDPETGLTVEEVVRVARRADEIVLAA